MRVDAGDTSLVVIDRPTVERVFGVFSAVVGGASAWLCMRFYRPGGDWGDLTLALLAPFLLIVAVAGVWRLLTVPTAICRVDGTRRVVELIRQAPLASRRQSWPFADIVEARAETRRGDESSWRLVLSLRDGRRVVLTPHTNADRESVERVVLLARGFMTTA
jgi:hypothetical protein